ncbi:hypothetical protein [Flagellimonas algicola]|uniref:Uncharacterized protein n=1 Tax=Flagellimonas algicola TaxID=2583815 RepID=A0ABY2WP15_9FLAO|nr:hypothetical protein [Allomuricauda algicola]TMU56730.1 hypothetical protein FGG15_04070 [Allomuricauda algicola]
MIENELIQIWQSSPKHERIKFEKSKLMLDVQTKLNSFDRAVKRRDFVEISAAILMTPLFLYQVYRQPNILAKIGAFWIAVYCGYVIYKLLKVKKTKPSETSTYLDYLKESKDYLEKQKKLLESILYWYILPGLTGCTIFLIGSLDLPNKTWQEIIKIKKVWVGLSAFTAVGVFTYWLNKRGVKKEFIPRLKKVNELIRLMEED